MSYIWTDFNFLYSAFIEYCRFGTKKKLHYYLLSLLLQIWGVAERGAHDQSGDPSSREENGDLVSAGASCYQRSKQANRAHVITPRHYQRSTTRSSGLWGKNRTQDYIFDLIHS